MTPAQFLARVKKNDVPAVCLFLGNEAYERGRCREAAAARYDSENGAMAHYDLSETELTDVIDDARAGSLFANERLILATSAEAMLPRTSKEDDDEEGSGTAGSGELLRGYIKDPTPGVVLILECSRFDLEGEDKKKSERVRKYFAAVPDAVEFKRHSVEEARVELQAQAKRMKLELDGQASALLVECLAADVARISTELEKLALFATDGRAITAEDILTLVPDARCSTIFALVNALGRKDRARSLVTLDSLVRENEYLPLALAFLSSQLRMALAARDSNLKTAQQIQGHFSKVGVPMWGSKAEQVAQTSQKFSKAELKRGLKLIFEADRNLRSARPDDRSVMEDFVVRLTA